MLKLGSQNNIASGLRFNTSLLSEIALPSHVRGALSDTSKAVQSKGDASSTGSAGQQAPGVPQSGSGASSGQSLQGSGGNSNQTQTPSGGGDGSGEGQATSTTVSTPPKIKFKFYHADASYNIRTGRASVREVYPGCNVVGWIGSDNSTLTFTNIDGGTTGGTRMIQVHYICAGGTRDAWFSVNGGAAKKFTLPSTGKKWDDFSFDFKVPLDGFDAGKKNILTISNPEGWSADFWRIGVEQK
ncbi:hypothetical protein QCA50_004120 [Cerrena zonata]|uniref:Uncharacterized protein n=1 Tax=Cerrena zonata TaxID=2478898 RepID=A0AAW0GN33_9APHY